MFTGIIEAVGEIADARRIGGDLRLYVRTGGLDLGDVVLGDSIATNGVCLTAVELPGDGFIADVSLETLDHTRLAEMKSGERVNLEKALMPTSRLGGHIVSGHVDGVGELVEKHEDARSVRLTIEAPAGLAKYIAVKGSITVDGVSLTVNQVEGSRFGLNIVPHTAAHTIIADYRPGQRVHLEVDPIARYLERLLSADAQDTAAEESSLTLGKLAAAGFLHRR